MRYSPTLSVNLDDASTSLTEKEHAFAVWRRLVICIGDGILTAHELEANVDEYEVTYTPS